MQRKTAKEAYRPTCAAPRLVDDAALFFETFRHVSVRTTYDQIYSGKEKKKKTEVRSRDGHAEHLYAKFKIYFLKTAWTFGLLCRKGAFYVVACNYLVLV